MTWLNAPYVAVLLVAGVTALLVVLYAWDRRRTAGGTYFILMMIAVALWALSNAAEFAALEYWTKIAWGKLSYVGIVSVSPLWLLFALSYSRRTGWSTRRWAAALWIVPALILALAVTNEWHRLVWPAITPVSDIPGAMLIYAHGPAVWVHAVYAYALLLIATATLVQTALRSPGLYRRQIGALLAGAVIPWIGNVLYLFGASPWPGLDLTPLAFVLTGLVLAWGLYRWQMLDLAPVARDALIENMSDGVFVLDRQKRIADINPAACRMIGCSAADAVGQPVNAVLARWSDLVERFRDVQDAQAEITEDGIHWLDLRISPLYDRHKELTGRLFVLRDITERKQAEDGLARQTEQLATLNRVGATITSGLDMDRVLRTLHEQCKQVAPIDTFYVALYDEETGLISFPMAYDQGEYRPWESQDIATQPGLSGRVIQSRQALYLPDSTDPGAAQGEPVAPIRTGGPPTRSYLGVPMILRDRVLGVLSMQSYQPNAYDPNHIRLLETIAAQAAVAVHNAQLYQRVVTEAGRRATLYRATQEIGAGVDAEHIAAAIHQAAAQVMPVEAVVIALLVNEGTEIDEIYLYDAGRRWPGERHPIGPGLTSYIVTTGRSLRTDDINDERIEQETGAEDFGVVVDERLAAIAVPLRHGGRVIGMLSVQCAAPSHYTAQDQELIEMLAAYGAAAFENARLYAEARRHSQELERQALELQAQRDFAQQVMNAMGQGLTVTDAEGRFEFVNPAYARLLGLTSADLVGKRPGDVTRPEDWGVLEQARARRQEGAASTYETRLTRADGSVAHVLITGTPRWRDGRVIGTIAAITDLTEYKRIEEEMRRLREDMTSMLVHDLRNPLGIISATLEFAVSDLADTLSADQRHALDNVVHQASKMRSMIDRILEIDQLERQQAPLAWRCAPVDVAPLIRAVLEQQRPLASASGLRLESAVPRALPLALADGELVGRVLQNLVDNALKFTPRGGTITVGAGTGESEGRPVLFVSVSDTGPGIPEEIRDRLFQRFVRGRQRERGSGLGLAFCKLAVEAQGGHIEVQGTPGRGATFTFTLGLAAPEDSKTDS